MEQDSKQRVSCPDCGGIKEITSTRESRLISLNPKAYSTLAKLECGHSIRVVMSEKNFQMVGQS